MWYEHIHKRDDDGIRDRRRDNDKTIQSKVQRSHTRRNLQIIIIVVESLALIGLVLKLRRM